MFEPGDPRHDEILDLANRATQISCPTASAPAGAELVRQLLGTIQSEAAWPSGARTCAVRPSWEVDILAPEEMASLATSTSARAALSIRIAEVIPPERRSTSPSECRSARSLCWCRLR